MSLLTGGPLVRNANDSTGQIVVQNQSNQTVTAVLISACSASSYGLNRMGRGERIEPGQRRAFTVSAGCWDVLAGNGGAEARERIQVGPNMQFVYTVE
ncbi:MAG TPA: hypothetical protein VD948_00855 [Rhodothermales bacterium]|nr:hypothetical protein [Rhodothermales bacterium]